MHREPPPPIPRCPACGSDVHVDHAPVTLAHRFLCTNLGCFTAFDGLQSEWDRPAYVASRERWATSEGEAGG